MWWLSAIDVVSLWDSLTKRGHWIKAKEIWINYGLYLGFPGDSVVKNLPANAGDEDLIPGSGRCPGEGNWQPTLVFLPGKSHGQRSLVGYSPRGCKESDTTEWLNNSNHKVAANLTTLNVASYLKCYDNISIIFSWYTICRRWHKIIKWPKVKRQVRLSE